MENDNDDEEKEKVEENKPEAKKWEAEDELTVTVKRRKNRQEEKAKKDAQIAAADHLAEIIFLKSISCSSCSSLKSTVSSLEEDIRLKDEEITQLKSEMANLTEATKVKKLMVASMEVENKQLKTRVAMGQHQTSKPGLQYYSYVYKLPSYCQS